jgi:phosphodiesterase/alkaline phosphatase D-like protein
MLSSRRNFLTVSGAAAALALTGSLPEIRAAAAGWTGRPDRRDPFTLGVASGDPLPDAVVIWTRLAPDPLAPFGGMDRRPVEVQWQVAEDEQFRRVVRDGTFKARPESSHSVHVDVRGLRPWRHYWYRFRVNGRLSPVGRTKTAPTYDTQLSELSLAFASCQAW